MYTRDLAAKALELSQKFPILAFLGPRQSGKTTLSKALFSQHRYVSLEDLDIHAFARNDPRAFLQSYPNDKGIILDEIQNVPELLSYIQTHSDDRPQLGFFILTGSQNFLINQAITQTLAGRVALLTLLPLSVHEMYANGILAPTAEQSIFYGGYPRIYTQKIAPGDWFQGYVRTYIERDIRQLHNVQDVNVFQNFLKLCAGRTGQLLNLTSLGNDCGISSVTAKSWISLLAQSYIIFLLNPHYKNFSKRLIKAPKLYFYDTALACFLLNIESHDALEHHYLRGGLFESFVIADLMKERYNKGRMPNMYFWRDKTGHEIDCILEQGQDLVPLEIKAGKTVSSSYFNELLYWNTLSGTPSDKNIVVYAGDEDQRRESGRVVSWKRIYDI